MSKPVRTAVTGCGLQGNVHLNSLNQIDTAELVAICEPQTDRLEKAGETFGVTDLHTDFNEMLESTRPELVTLATPVVFHARQAVAAFDAGAHVLCEKPLAMNVDEAEKMFEAAKRNGKKLGMGLQNRYRTEAVYLKEFIDRGELGRIFHGRSYSGHKMNIPGYGQLHRNEMSGGGVMFATAVHSLDLVIWLMGNPEPVRVSAQSYQRIHQMQNPPITWNGPLEDFDVEDFISAIVHFDNGASLDIISDWLHHDYNCSGLELFGDYGMATYNPLRITLDDGASFKEIKPEIENEGDFQGVVADLVRCIQEDETPRYLFSEMRNVQRIMNAAYRSIEEGREVEA